MRYVFSSLSLGTVLTGLILAFPSGQANGGEWTCSTCVGKGLRSAVCEHAYQYQERTILVPTMVTERRVVEVTECRTEVHERTVMVPKMTPEIKQVRDVYTVMVPCKIQNCDQGQPGKPCDAQGTICVPQKREAIRNISTFRTDLEPRVERYEVQVPRTVQKEIEIQVCRLVPQKVICCVPTCP